MQRGMEAMVAGALAAADARAGAGVAAALRRAGAVLLGLLATVPVYALLDRPETGLAGRATADMASTYASFVWSGLLLLLIPALLFSRFSPADGPDRLGRAVARVLLAPRLLTFALTAGAIAFTLAWAVSAFVLRGEPNLIDAMAQLLHARVLADGRLAGPGPELGAFWQPQQSLFTENGWVSQYPPLHALLLAAGFKVGAVQLVGPLMLALTAVFTTLAAEALLPERRAEARFGGLLVAVSPFLLGHAAAYMNHAPAAAFGAFAVWCVVRSMTRPFAAEGKGFRLGAAWLLGAGAGLGAMFAVRPVSALTLGLALAGWLVWRAGPLSFGALRAVLMILAGALPFALGVAAYNAHFFGSPFTFGYTAALGPDAGLGFGLDPWGNRYGPLEALAYTSAELTALGLFLTESPLPLVAVVAVWLLIVPRLGAGERLLVLWATLPLLVQAAYWHHGLFMGPRLLYESAPAWCVLVVLAAGELVRRTPLRLATGQSYSPRAGLALVLAGGLAVGLGVFAPQRMAAYAQRPVALESAAVAESPALIFVHGGWTSRLAMRLAAAGMRLDSVEAALRQNPTCAVQHYADARVSGAPLPPLDLAPRATGLPAQVELSPGNRIRVAGSEPIAGVCAAEAAADRFGTIDVTPLLWRGDPPGTDGPGVLFVRDLGPDANRAMLAVQPARRPYVLFAPAPDRPPVLAEYDDAMRLLWGRPGA